MMKQDPVCGMVIDEKDVAGLYSYKGKIYYFCALKCKDLFVKDPGKYIKE